VQQLQELGVELAQGYWFSRALDARAFGDLLRLRKPFALPEPGLQLAH
jgi:EAL domain-containing protein (putative c-di-GMP-specific phosphodiesterase class I)